METIPIVQETKLLGIILDNKSHIKLVKLTYMMTTNPKPESGTQLRSLPDFTCVQLHIMEVHWFLRYKKLDLQYSLKLENNPRHERTFKLQCTSKMPSNIMSFGH